MSLKGDWITAGRENPCPVCGHGKTKDDGCYFIPPGTVCKTSDGRAYVSAGVAVCRRIESSRMAPKGGWIHKGPWTGVVAQPSPRPRAQAQPPRQDLQLLARRFATSVNPTRLERLGADLGLSVQVLHEFGIGWAGERYCNKCDKRLFAWSFHMVDHTGQLTGFRLRFIPCNHKSAIFGSKEGLFIPQRLLRDTGAGTDASAASKLFITEGPTDAAALLDLDLEAIGRPSNVGGLSLIRQLLRARFDARKAVHQLVIVADGDGPGQSGARQLASIVRPLVPIVQIITPPAGIKDARDWKRSGATAADIERAVWAAPRRTLSINSTLKGIS